MDAIFKIRLNSIASMSRSLDICSLCGHTCKFDCVSVILIASIFTGADSSYMWISSDYVIIMNC